MDRSGREHGTVKILAVDPGDTSGLAMGWWGVDAEPIFRSWEEDTLTALQEVDLFTRSAGEKLVVIERWTPQPGVRSFQPSALESIGATRYLTWRSQVPLVLQTATDAKHFATNEKLARMGWRNPSPGDHRDDAARHLLLAAVARGLVDPAVFL